MNPFFSAIIYAATQRRISCSHCGSYDHHRRIGPNCFLCNSCRQEFTPELNHR
ncbi:hypothetical protein [Geomonas sp.]|uniref:hypothetical protein n=1 Tax=Geomonas sp. TaxID=2651584 RepID=UPI002B488ACB|nr:hypothetical protein [Geomonas sp.]HJV34466.1 hypothetical protein [Geomonas sp.]